PAQTRHWSSKSPILTMICPELPDTPRRLC
ncbi:MAG: hypothetical protein ACJA0W_003823, partial [Candidatus Azotimanducaceae bacterium]